MVRVGERYPRVVTLLGVCRVYGVVVHRFGISPVRDSIASILHNTAPEIHYIEGLWGALSTQGIAGHGGTFRR